MQVRGTGDVWRGWFRALLIGLFCVGALDAGGISPAAAQSILSGGTIEEIRIEGTHRIDPTTVRSYLRVEPGEAFDPVRIDSSLKSLFATGFFADVTLRRDGDALIVAVTENPIINQVAFEGNKRLDDEILQSEIGLRPRVVFTRTKVQSDVQRILEVYRRQGRYGATVDAKVIQLPQRRVDLVFEINEGSETEIVSINFIGNRVFSDSKLRGEISSREAAFWRFLSASDTFDPDRLTFDRELLRRFYLGEGFADFRVLSAVAELTPDRGDFIITFTVEEGQRYQFGTIELTSSFKSLDTEALRKGITTEEATRYDASAVEDTVTNLTTTASNLGFAFVDVRPQVDRDRDNRLINITYDIRQGPKVYVERIDIQGNIRTLDQVIRREFRLVEGDAFNASLLRLSRRHVESLGFFRSVDVAHEPGSSADRAVIAVEVEEQATGDLSFAAGFSTEVGPVGTIGVRERNLLGRGQDLQLAFTLSGAQSQLQFGFTEPRFMERDLAVGLDLFRIVTDRNASSFDEEATGGSVRAGYDLGENLRQVWRYSLEYTDITGVDSDASAVIQSDAGDDLESSIGSTLTYDKRDSRFDPHEGYVARLNTKLAGFGGDVRYLKNTIAGSYHYPFSDNITGSVSSEIGHLIGLDYDTKAKDRFFVGGSSLRGFKPAGIGPRDGDTDDALGGKNFYTGSLQLSFPVGVPEELNLRGRVFSDVGSLWDLDGSTSDVLDDNSPRVSVGFGMSWFSPFGPLVIDFGFPVVEEEYDETEAVTFSFGTRF